MGKILHVTVANRIATYNRRDGAIVCGNSDYQIQFVFDAEWNAYNEKTARFIWGGQYVDVGFAGSTCSVPRINGADKLEVGVYAGDLQTTTSATIPCMPSILCKGAKPHPEMDAPNVTDAMKAAQEAKASADAAAESAVAAEAAKDDLEEARDAAGASRDAAAQSAAAAAGAYDNMVRDIELAASIVQNQGDSQTAVMSQAGVTKGLDDAKKDLLSATDMRRITGGHFVPIDLTYRTKGNVWQESSSGVTSVQGTEDSTGKMLAPKNICVSYGEDTKSGIIINFYQVNSAGEYELDRSFFDTGKTSSGKINLANYARLKQAIIRNIPNGTYVEFVHLGGYPKPEVYAWDGESFGMDVCASASYPTTSSSELWLSDAGGSGITVHGKATHIVTKGVNLRIVKGYKDGVATLLDSTAKGFYQLPRGYDYFRIRIDVTAVAGVNTTIGNMSDRIFVVADVINEIPISNAKKIIDNCRKICELTWTPAKTVVVNEKTTLTYKEGVKYRGIPYGGLWALAHYVGWHVSPHTFLNAANDPDSIFYDATMAEETGGAPFYSTVCSAFATLCDGWPCPQTNAGFFYDPEVETYYSYKPVLGHIYTDVWSHCLIPSEIAQTADDTIISAYESVKPLSLKTARFMSINWADIWDWWDTAAGNDYYDTYGYVVHNPRAKSNLSLVPYIDLAGAFIANGSARPWKGDKSVYTSAESEVRINIKDATATTLYLQRATWGTMKEIPINGATSVDVKPYLDAANGEKATDNIYSVCTDADHDEESFEYVVVTPITYSVTDTSLTFSTNDFWYASCYATGHPHFKDRSGYSKMTACVLARKSGDYSDWFRNGQKLIGVSGIFKKGVYGAYNVPFSVVE